jgi:hypothetical protein
MPYKKYTIKPRLDQTIAMSHAENGIDPIMYALQPIPIRGTTGTHGHENVRGGADVGN